MRSAETSGVTAKGALVPRSRLKTAGRAIGQSLWRSVFRRGAEISPTSYAVAGTALGAAGLFTLYEQFRSAAQADALARLAEGQDLERIAGGAWEHALVAFAVALLVAVLALRRRASADNDVETRRRIEDFVATIPFGVALWTDTGELAACNSHYRDRLDAEGVLGSGASYEESIRRLVAGGYVQIVGDGESRRLMELRRQDGLCLLIDERPLPRGGFVTLITDITERKRADMLLSAVQAEQRQLARRYHEEKLKAEAASRAKTSFLAHLSHDIRTPLNHIIGFADLIRHQTYGPLGDPRYLNYVDMIKGSGERLLASFAAILELAELEGGNRPLREGVVGVDELLAAVARRFSAQAGRAGVHLTRSAPCEARIVADRFCLERMLGNLVENAIRFTPSGGRITLAAYAAPDGIVLEVSDTGIGMTEAQLDRLSQPFVFGDAAFTREHEGAGLGIAISRAIATLSGGRLVIDSTPAIGTTVAVSLPLQRERPLMAEAA